MSPVPDRPDPKPGTTQFTGLGRSILALAVPALGALIAEPVFLLADTAIIGHLGVEQLAGAGLGMTVLQTVVGLMVFLAYATTPTVARWFGAGRPDRALAAGRDGCWLAAGLGLILSLVGWLVGEWLLTLLGAKGATLEFALSYLHWSLPGLPAMLLVLAATGTLRGLQDGRTPLIVAGCGFAANIGFNLWFVYGLDLSVAGSALGTSLAQWGMALAYLVMLIPRTRAAGVSLWPTGTGLRRSAAGGTWLMLRTVSLRISVLATTWVATGQGSITLAAHQLVFTFFSTLAFALDALAVAAQSLVGKELGAGNRDRTSALTALMTRWGLGFGVFTGLLLAAVAWVVPGWFIDSPDVVRAATAGLLVLALSQPICGVVFVLDGVLIGAGDARYLALAGIVALVAYLPLLAVVRWAQLPGQPLAWIWAAMTGYLLARAATLVWRIRTPDWIRLGVGDLA